MDGQNAKDMLEALARTANAHDYAAHMDLISPTVNVYGTPGFDVIGYDDWARQCRHEFDNGLLKQVSYQGRRVVSMTPDNVLFKIVETVEGAGGTVNHHGVETLIHKKANGRWRMTQERILPVEEGEFDRRPSH